MPKVAVLICAILLLFLESLEGTKNNVVKELVAADDNAQVLVMHRPPNESPKGIVLVLHGCKHSVNDFFHPREVVGGCEECLGLPQGVGIAQTVTSSGYVMAAMNSANIDKGNKCWDKDVDIDHVYAVKKHLYSSYKLGGAFGGDAEGDAQDQDEVHPPLPFIIIGISSGGYLAFEMAAHHAEPLGLDGIICIASTLTPELSADKAFNNRRVAERPPPTAVIGMFRDVYTSEQNTRAVIKYGTIGIPIKEYVAYPKAIHPRFFVEYAGLSFAMSQALLKVR
jgi:hypothetical protein